MLKKLLFIIIIVSIFINSCSIFKTNKASELRLSEKQNFVDSSSQFDKNVTEKIERTYSISVEGDSLRWRYGQDFNGIICIEEILKKSTKKDTINISYEQIYNGKPYPIAFYSENDSLVINYSEKPTYFNLITKQDTISLKVIYKKSPDYLKILTEHAKYDYYEIKQFAKFTYQDASDSNLVKLQKKYELKKVAGAVDEISKIINLMRWVHNVVRHDGNSENPEPRNSLNLIQVCQDSSRGVNCRMMTIILNEVYLSLGFKSRFITCMPKGEKFDDCHVINIVYSKTMDKWVYMDPTFEAYFKDENGILLNPEEVRKKMINGDSLTINNEINWNGKPYNKKHYLQYMAKNLFRFSCPIASEFGYESKNEDIRYVYLNPEKYNPQNLKTEYETKSGKEIYSIYIKNPDYFWQKPK